MEEQKKQGGKKLGQKFKSLLVVIPSANVFTGRK